MTAKHDGALKDLIFLLGAGASVDAGMPMVKQLTQELRQRLPNIPDVNGIPRPEFSQVFDLIEAQDPSVAGNYERFFEWIKFLFDAHQEPFRRIVEIKLARSLVDAIGPLIFVIGGEIGKLLESHQSEPSYLARLVDFLPTQGRLKVFSLNYDCCLEDACQSAGIDLTTGFDPHTRRWNPSLFQTGEKGVNLYKLHGSLRWHYVQDETRPIEEPQQFCKLMELKPEEHQGLPSSFNIRHEPELILGPGSKLQPDDPFLTLFYEFHRSIQQAKVCVVIGYSFGDPHISGVLDRALDTGVCILEVNPGSLRTRYWSSRYRHIQRGAKSALVDGKIRSELEGMST